MIALAVAAIAGCPVFPADNPWNQRVDSLPVHPRSDAIVRSIGVDDAQVCLGSATAGGTAGPTPAASPGATAAVSARSEAATGMRRPAQRQAPKVARFAQPA